MCIQCAVSGVEGDLAEVEETLANYICQRLYIQNEQRTLANGPPTTTERNPIHIVTEGWETQWLRVLAAQA